MQAPPQGSPQASRLLSVVLWAGCLWVRCLRRVWKRRIEHGGGAAAQTRTPCVWCGISHWGHHFRGLSDVTLISGPAGNQTGATLARSKALNHYPMVAAYFWKVWYAGSSTPVIFTPALFSYNLFSSIICIWFNIQYFKEYLVAGSSCHVCSGLPRTIFSTTTWPFCKQGYNTTG